MKVGIDIHENHCVTLEVTDPKEICYIKGLE